MVSWYASVFSIHSGWTVVWLMYKFENAGFTDICCWEWLDHRCGEFFPVRECVVWSAPLNQMLNSLIRRDLETAVNYRRHRHNIEHKCIVQCCVKHQDNAQYTDAPIFIWSVMQVIFCPPDSVLLEQAKFWVLLVNIFIFRSKIYALSVIACCRWQQLELWFLFVVFLFVASTSNLHYKWQNYLAIAFLPWNF